MPQGVELRDRPGDVGIPGQLADPERLAVAPIEAPFEPAGHRPRPARLAEEPVLERRVGPARPGGEDLDGVVGQQLGDRSRQAVDNDERHQPAGGEVVVGVEHDVAQRRRSDLGRDVGGDEVEAPLPHTVVAQRPEQLDPIGHAVGGRPPSGGLQGTGVAVDGHDGPGRVGGGQPQGQRPVPAPDVEHGPDAGVALGRQPAEEVAGAGVDAGAGEHALQGVELDAHAVLLEGQRRLRQRIRRGGRSAQSWRRRAAASPKVGSTLSTRSNSRRAWGTSPARS
jgi:hypothetical protein